MTRDEFCETARIRLIQYLERNRRVRLADIADDMGYRPETMIKFANGSAASFTVATALIAYLPELFDGLVCPTCNRLITG